jgi:tRNA (cytidine/uridine-2'-O-)-methyltransferase
MSTQADASYLGASYGANEVILLGRESVGVPEAVHQAADLRVKIPMRDGMRSLNVALACAMVVGEALRQTGGFPAQ